MKKTKLKVIRAAQAALKQISTLTDEQILKLAAEKKRTMLHKKARELVRERRLDVRPKTDVQMPCSNDAAGDWWRKGT
jgi:hypothetical protein